MARYEHILNKGDNMELVSLKSILDRNLPIYFIQKNLEEVIEENVIDKVEIKEALGAGVYNKTMYLPPDFIIVGALHKKPTTNIVLEGSMIINVNGKNIFVQAGDSFITEANTKKLGKSTREGCVFMNVFHTEETDITKVKQDIVYTQEEEKALYNIILNKIGDKRWHQE